MSGLYLHIPFCKSRCIYCDFYSTTSKENLLPAFVKAVCKELEVRREEANNDIINTIYWGGGTPSCLPVKAIAQIFDTIQQHYQIAPDAEITLEANPDDIEPQFITEIKELGINRFSLGVQTFNNNQLHFLGRRHTGENARKAVMTIAEAGFENISIDLIYSLPQQTLKDWDIDVNTALELPIKHLSAYSLMYEEGTRLTALRNRGIIEETEDELSVALFNSLIDRTTTAGFEHYEISNFALSGYRSRHNSSYWNNSPYIGIGPGAHSFDGKYSRRCNKENLMTYSCNPGHPPHSIEKLNDAERCDELVFTALRTCEGLDMEILTQKFGNKIARHIIANAQPHIAGGLLSQNGNKLKLTHRGIFLSDMVMRDLMIG